MEMAVQELTKGHRWMTQLRLISGDQSETVRELSEGVMRAIEAGLSILAESQEPMALELNSAGSAPRTQARSINKGVKRAHSADSAPIRKMTRRDISTRIITYSPFGDGYRWRKYGQKNIQNSEHPRSYYKCSYLGCNAKKQVQQINSSYQYEVIFSNEHTCSSNSKVHPIPQIILPSPERESQVISFSSTDSASVNFPLRDAEKQDKQEDGLDSIAPLSPSGQFYGSDISAYYGMEENLDLMVPYL